MKLFIGLVFTTFGFNNFSFSADLSGYQINNCDVWTTSSAGSGFVCAGWPTTVTVAEATSYAREIRILEKKIAEMEQRILNLEKAKP